MSYRIVIPIHNEAKNIKKLLDSFSERHLSSIILVNDGSTDKTLEIIETNYPKIEVLSHRVNLGKGKSLQTGALKAFQDKAGIIIFMDGDLQHKPEDIARFLRAFRKDPKLQIVFGARKIGINMRFASFFGNKILTVTINLLFRYFLNDTQCGFRAFRRTVFPKIIWNSPDYAAETEIIIKAAKNKLKYKEIPIDTIYLDHNKGTYFIHGIIILFKIIFWRVTSYK
ncbi:glycosyltransferase family 2 protein [Candidatus Peregrinibacteria bacterium]|nr:glycosyltransferase family 2 protein [Candidatus Peregrinibacteria bacterium]